LLLGMNLSVQPRVRNLFVDWGHRGLKGLASSLGVELEARSHARVRGVWVREGEEVLEIPWEMGFKCSATPKAATWWGLWTTRGTPRPS